MIIPERLPIFEDYIEGGRAQGKSPEDYDPFEMDIGTRVEFEHVNTDPELKDLDLDDEEKMAKAQEIAMDHIEENDNYYLELYLSGIADEDISDILDKWEDDPRADRIRAFLETSEDDIHLPELTMKKKDLIKYLNRTYDISVRG